MDREKDELSFRTLLSSVYPLLREELMNRGFRLHEKSCRFVVVIHK